MSLSETLLESELVRRGATLPAGLVARYDMIKSAFASSARFINTRNQNLTDHGEGHVRRVQRVIVDMLGTAVDSLTDVEIYLLCCASYFHDWGNLIDRQGHRDYCHNMYNSVFAAALRNMQESTVIDRLVWAHSGQSSAGDMDTLKELDEKATVYGNPVSVRRLAAILRLADELAESPERTSLKHVEGKRLNQKSLCHHLYAQSIDVACCHGESRVVINLHVGFLIDRGKHKAVFVGAGKKVLLEAFVDFMEYRLRKTDQERKYANYYLNGLLCYRELSVNVKFLTVKKSPSSGEGFDREVVARRFVMDDKEVPGARSYPVKLFDFSDIVTCLGR